MPKPLAGGQLHLLRRPSFRLLFLASLGSGVGTWLAFVALTVDVFDRTRSGTWVSALLIADALPIVIVGLAAGPLIDRLSRRRLMIASDLLRFAVFCALPFAGSATQIVALAGVAGLATAVFRPAVFAGVPNLVEDRELPNANSLLQGIENLTWMAGPLAGGALVAARGPHLAYWVNAGTFLLSAALIAGIPGRLLQAAAAVSRGHWRDLGEGFALARRSRSLATVLIAWSVAVFVAAGINVADVALAKRSFHAGDFGFGLLVGSTGLGLVLGSFLAAPWIRRSGMAPVYGAAIGLMAAGFGGAAVSPSVWVAAACIVVAGAGNGAAVVCNALFVQRGALDRVRGRAFTVVMSANFLMLALGMAAAGPLIDSVGARWVFGGAGALAGVAAAIGFLLARGAPEAGDGEAEPLPLLAYPPAPGRSTSLD